MVPRGTATTFECRTKKGVSKLALASSRRPLRDPVSFNYMLMLLRGRPFDLSITLDSAVWAAGNGDGTSPQQADDLTTPIERPSNRGERGVLRAPGQRGERGGAERDVLRPGTGVVVSPEEHLKGRTSERDLVVAAHLGADRVLGMAMAKGPLNAGHSQLVVPEEPEISLDHRRRINTISATQMKYSTCASERVDGRQRPRRPARRDLVKVISISFGHLLMVAKPSANGDIEPDDRGTCGRARAGHTPGRRVSDVP
ncbi:hypothetical protein FB451DRAFT_1187002 [Mycena latifolia]|nr:hypothetical protein FB451DRAFT_1187002 [Mycena latifolia]